MKRRIHHRTRLGIALALLGLLGCSAIPDIRDRPFGHNHTGPETVDQTAAVVFFLDGLNAAVFRDLLDGGRLPNIKKYFVDRGLYVERCTANVPSVTLANETSVVTGLFPGHHGITTT